MSKTINRSIVLLIFSIIAVSFCDAPMHLDKVLWPPSFEFPFGLDEMGRDYLIVLCKGSLLTFVMGTVSLFSALILVSLLMVFNFIAPQYNFLLMRLIEVLDSLPDFLWIFLILNLVGYNISNEFRIFLLSILIGLFGSTVIYRKIKFLWQQTVTENYVQGVVALGASNSYLMRKHLLPRMFDLCWPILVYYWTIFLLTESFISFLGFGIRPPMYSLGSLLNKGWQYFYTATHLLILPGLILTLVFLSARIKLRTLPLRGSLKAQETDQ